MQNDRQIQSLNQSSKYSNPNEPKQSNIKLNNPQPVLKKTSSQFLDKSSHRSSLNSQNLNTKLPKIILEFIAEKTREQNQNRLNASKQNINNSNLSSLKRKSRFSHQSQNNNQLFQEEEENIQRLNSTLKIKKTIVSFKIPELDSKKSSKHKITCPICLIQGPKKQFVTISNNECDHQYCRSCMHQYLIFKIKMFQKVTCPDENCDVNLKLSSSIFSQLPIDTRQKFQKILKYNEVLASENKRICPNQNCDGILDVTDPQKNPRCNSCNVVYCRKCFFPNHAGQCDPFQLKFFQETLNYRQCDQCKNVIQKNQGCNHMTCRCGYQFCYVCGQKWSSNHICEQLRGQYVPDQCSCCCCQCEFCDACDYCCECMCFDEWQLCEIRPIRWLFKFLIILLVLIVGIPLWIVFLIAHLLVNIFMGIMIGLFVLPCEPICEQSGNCLWIILGIVFLPITMVVFIVKGIKQALIEDEGIQEIIEQLYLPCEAVNEIIQL